MTWECVPLAKQREETTCRISNSVLRTELNFWNTWSMLVLSTPRAVPHQITVWRLCRPSQTWNIHTMSAQPMKRASTWECAEFGLSCEEPQSFWSTSLLSKWIPGCLYSCTIFTLSPLMERGEAGVLVLLKFTTSSFVLLMLSCRCLTSHQTSQLSTTLWCSDTSSL